MKSLPRSLRGAKNQNDRSPYGRWRLWFLGCWCLCCTTLTGTAYLPCVCVGMRVRMHHHIRGSEAAPRSTRSFQVMVMMACSTLLRGRARSRRKENASALLVGDGHAALIVVNELLGQQVMVLGQGEVDVIMHTTGTRHFLLSPPPTTCQTGHRRKKGIRSRRLPSSTRRLLKCHARSYTHHYTRTQATTYVPKP